MPLRRGGFSVLIFLSFSADHDVPEQTTFNFYTLTVIRDVGSVQLITFILLILENNRTNIEMRH